MSSVTFRMPGVLAIQVAQVDEMSRGRVELGLGAGWFEREHLAYGIPFPAKRFALLEEQLELVTGLWSTPVGETYTFSGEHYALTDSPALPKPVQTRVPVIVGGNGPRRTPELAARFATEFNLGFPPVDDIPVRIARVHAACERIGRDPRPCRSRSPCPRSRALTTSKSAVGRLVSGAPRIRCETASTSSAGPPRSPSG